MKVLVKGAGVAGLATAYELSRRDVAVTVVERQARVGGRASWYAGGMLAPWCEREAASERVLEEGAAAADWWERALPGQVHRNGTLVVAPRRDRAELVRFASRTGGHEVLDELAIARLEPDLVGRFREGLFFAGEAHLDPRVVMNRLHGLLKNRGVEFRLGTDAGNDTGFDCQIDCTGLASRAPGLRGVRGEMLLLHTSGLNLSRPVRLLHPRIPVYVVPRDDGLFMVGATMLESGSAGPATARSVMELLNAAYALHPAFGEAQIIEIGAEARPAFQDNHPRVSENDGEIQVNGLFRHGFLLAPHLARQAADRALACRRNAHD